ncbi:MAG: TerB family tellurite resistance protein [Candidatus Binatia bacterium]
MTDSAQRLIARLAVAMMAADGRVTPVEVEALGRLEAVGVGPIARLAAEELERAAREPIDLRATVEGLGRVGADAAAVLLGAIAEIAAADRIVAPRELEVFDAIAACLGIASGDAREILAAASAAHSGTAGDRTAAPFRSPVGAEPPPAAEPAPAAPAPPGPDEALVRALRRLGLDHPPTRATLDESYLHLVKRFDPARMIELGPEFVTLAVRRLATITRAYETVLHAITGNPTRGR